MTISQFQRRIEFACIMSREFPRAANLAARLAELMWLSRRHVRLQADAYNGDVPDDHDARCEAKIRAVCQAIDAACVPVFIGDHRGCTVKLRVPSGRTNDWGGTGICVPQ